MSETPRTDQRLELLTSALNKKGVSGYTALVKANFARQLERENADLRRQLEVRDFDNRMLTQERADLRRQLEVRDFDNRMLTQERADLRKQLEEAKCRSWAAKCRIVKLEDQLVEAKKDSERLDWVDANNGSIVFSRGEFGASAEGCCNAGWYVTPRAAIDAAKAKGASDE